MKTKYFLILLITFLFISCNGGGGGGSDAATSNTLDARLFSGTGRWESYDAGTNIDDIVVFTRVTLGDGTISERMFWDERYRSGSRIIDAEYYLEPIGGNGVNAVEFNGTLRTGDFSGSYTFIDDDTLELCSNACFTLTRVP